MKKINNKNLAIIAILTALAVILKMVVIYIFLNNRLVFHNIPIIIIGFLYGPLFGSVSAIVSDILSIIITPNWNPLFLIPQIFWGLIPGIFGYLYKNKLNTKRVFVIELLSYLAVSICNTIIMCFLYSPAVALGIIKKSKDLILGFEFLNLSFNINLGSVFYIGILVKIIIMVIKIPIDCLILKKLLKKFALKLDLEYA